MQVPSACVGGSADGSLLTQTNVERVLLLLKTRDDMEAALDKLKFVSGLTQGVFEQVIRQVLVVGVSLPGLLDELITGLEKVSESYAAIMYLQGNDGPGKPHVPDGFFKYLTSHCAKACPNHPKRGFVVLGLALLVASCWTQRSSEKDGRAQEPAFAGADEATENSNAAGSEVRSSPRNKRARQVNAEQPFESLNDLFVRINREDPAKGEDYNSLT